jgi:PPM family protein phosphatase
VTAEQAAGSGLRLDALTAHLGPRSPDPLRSHVASYSVMAGDRFLLCTDGVHRQVTHDELASIVSGAETCAAGVEGLLTAARRAGGRDNAAAALIQFERIVGGSGG